MLDSETLLLSVVTRLLDDPTKPARLLALGDAAAVLAMPDGSLAALFTPAFGPPEVLGDKLGALVEDNPGTPLKLAIVGGDAAARALLPTSGAGLLSRRVVQLFHLGREPGGGPGPHPAWSLWTGGGGRPDSPLGAALVAASRGELPAPSRAALAGRVERRAPLAPDERERLLEGQAFMNALRVPSRLTWSLLGVLGLVFALEELWGGSETVPTLVRMGGNTQATLTGEPWRLLSSALLHAGWLHIGVNGFVLLVLGGFLERVLGAARLGVLLGTAAVGGSVASALLSSAPLSVGASGAIWGVLGAAAALSWRPGQVIPAVVVGPLRRNAMINVVINVAASFLPQVDAWAHLGGGLVGALLVLGGVLTRGLVRPGSGPSSGGRGFTVAAGLVALLAASSLCAAWAHARPWQLVAAPPAFVRHVLGPVSIEAPALLGDPIPVPTARVSLWLLGEPVVVAAPPGTSAWVLGDPMRDPMVVVVKVQAQSSESFAWRVHGIEATPPPGTPWEHRAGDERPTLTAQLTTEDGTVVDVLAHIREEADVWVEIERWPSLAPRWAGAVERVHASLSAAAP